MSDFNYIPLGLNIPSQIPLDAKQYVYNEDSLKSLGSSDQLAFTYVKGYIFYCIQEGTRFEWREVLSGSTEKGLMDNDYVYPDNVIVFGIDYSLKSYNFFRIDYENKKYFQAGSNTTLDGDGSEQNPFKYNAVQIQLSAGSNISFTGIGTEADPLVINAIVFTQQNTDWNAVSGVTELLNKPNHFPPSAHTHSIADIDYLQSFLDKAELKENKGVPLGYVPLNIFGKIDEQYIEREENEYVNFKGYYNASLNIPQLPLANTVKGHYYEILEDGIFQLIDYKKGDWIISDGNSWKRVSNQEYTDEKAQIAVVSRYIRFDVENKSPSEKAVYDLSQDIFSQINEKENTINKGIPGGYVPLGIDGKINLAYISDTLLGNVVFQGLWSPATNTPNLTVVAPKGHYYIVTDNGTRFGLDFNTGDWIISIGTSWEKVDNTDAVSSVFGRVGNVTSMYGDYNTSQIIESTNKNFQTDLQKLYNDATSSIQTQLNNRSLIDHTHNLQSVVNAGNTVVNSSMYFKNSSGVQEAYYRESDVSFNYTQSYGLAGLYQSSFGAQGINFAFTSNTDSLYNTLFLSTDNLSGGGSKQVKIQNKSGTIALLSDIPAPVSVDQSIIDGSTNAVSGNAVFDGLALKADLSNVVTISKTQTITGQKTFTALSTIVNTIEANSRIQFPQNTGITNSIIPIITRKNDKLAIFSDVSGSPAQRGALISTSGLTADRTFSFPDNTGTFALTSDLSGYSPTTHNHDHNTLTNLQGGAVGDYQHVTTAEKNNFHNPVTINTANGLSLSNQVLSLGLASSGVTGALSGTDWNTFNSKQPALGFTPENVANKATTLTASSTAYPNNNAVISGLATKEPSFTKNTAFNKNFGTTAGTVVEGGTLGSNAYNSTAFLPLSGGTLTGILNIDGVDSPKIFFQQNSSLISLVTNNFGINGTGSKTDFNTYVYGNNPYGIWTNGVKRVTVGGDGSTTFSGTISASPATTANQVVIKSQLDAVARPYKVYTALLSQAGTNAPTIIVLENTLGATISMARQNTGHYRTTISIGNFPANKTFKFIQNGNYTITKQQILTAAVQVNTPSFDMYTEVDGVKTDNVLQNAAYEIRIYP